MRYFTPLGFLVFVLSLPLTAIAQARPDPLQQEVADAVRRTRNTYTNVLGDLARRDPRSMRYMEQYVHDPHQYVNDPHSNVVWGIGSAAAAVHSDESIRLLSAMFHTDFSGTIYALWSYDCSRLRRVGGNKLKLGLEGELEEIDRAPLLLTCFKDDPGIAAKLEKARTTMLASRQNSSGASACDIALLALGNVEAKAHLLKSIQQRDPSTALVLAGDNGVRFINDPDVLLALVEGLRDEQPILIESNSSRPGVRVIERVCDSILWQLSGKSGVNVGVEVHYDPFALHAPELLYTDAQLVEAYTLLKAYYSRRAQQR